jgi:List-Bact-rpt repeat protein
MPFTVTYNGNGSDGGSVPVDTNGYNPGDTVTVQLPGSMSKTGATFAYWNTNADGTGTFYGWPVAGSFPMPAANVTLNAQWFVNTGLSNGGATTHYVFSYDSSLRASGLEPGRTQNLMNGAEGDYGIMQNWFPGVTPAGPSPIKVYVTRLTGGANNTGDIRLKPNTNDPKELRCYLVSEITESFMSGQNKGWGFLPGVNNEESCGEGLSLFLTQQFAVSQGFAQPYTTYTTNTATAWLNSSLPVNNSSSTRFFDKTSTSQGYDYGSRVDYVNSVLPWFGNGPGTGCSILFLYYLFHQLGFTINQIIAAAPGYTNGALNASAPLRGVYQNLTGDNSDPSRSSSSYSTPPSLRTRCPRSPVRIQMIPGR